MATPRPSRRPLGSLAANGSSLNGFNKESPEHDERDYQLKASLSALTGKSAMMAPIARRQSGNTTSHAQEMEPQVGDEVIVPGDMTGIVKFIGPVKDKRGTFAGVELSEEYAARGKNDGDVDGISYFTVSIAGAGIFLPSYKATRLSSTSSSAGTFPPTPTTPSFSNFDTNRKTPLTTRTPPTGSIPKFSQSLGPSARHPFSQTMGPGARAPSPQLKPKSRPSLPRPKSPFRKQPNLPPQPATIGRGSVRPVRPSGVSTPSAPRLSKPATPGFARSPSRSQSRAGAADSSPLGDNTPTPAIRPKMSMRGLSSQRSTTTSDEALRLQRELDERDKQLKEQALALAEMESTLAEVQSLMATNLSQKPSPGAVEPGTEDIDAAELRAMLKTKQDRIDTLTKEFDKNRADFRSTIDTLEIAASTTEQIYEQRTQDLMAETEALQRDLQDLRNDKEEVQQFQDQYKQFEEAVAELEEAVENARRGEAEAKAESEFLHGEVERVRAELKDQRKKAADAVKGATAAVDEGTSSSPGLSTRDLEQRDTEIKGLKAMIAALTASTDARSPSPTAKGIDADAEKALTSQISALQREKSELRGLIDRKNYREEELERENARLRSASGMPNNYPNSAASVPQTNGISHHNNRDSVSTATMHTANRNSATSTATAFRSSTRGSYTSPPQSHSRPTSGNMARPKSSSAAPAPLDEKDGDDASTTEGSQADTDSQWCELCEITGHDILTCSMMLGTDSKGHGHTNGISKAKIESPTQEPEEEDRTITMPAAEASRTSPEQAVVPPVSARSSQDDARQPHKDEIAPPVLPAGDGPAPGKDSGKIDMSKWCAMCERDGHESVDCPFEEY